MLSTDEKLKKFSESVYKDAQNQSSALKNKAKNLADAEIDAFETECLEAAYKTIKKQMAQIVRAANERVSKAETDARRTVLLKREEAIKEIFSAVNDKLAAYKNTEEYKKYLLDLSEKAKEYDVGEGVTICISKSDEHIAGEIKNKSGVCVQVVETDDYIGGICVFVNGTNKKIDLSFASRMEEAKEAFLSSSRLTL